MKVKCIKIINHITGKAEEKSSWLTIGKIYDVLEILMAENEKVVYRVVSEERTPILTNAEQFILIDNNIPLNWRVKIGEYGGITFSSEKWLKDEFWEDFFNQEEYAEKLFEEEKIKIIKGK